MRNATETHSWLLEVRRSALWPRKRPIVISRGSVLAGVALWVLLFFGMCLLSVWLLSLMGAPWIAALPPLTASLLYIVRVGLYAIWPRTRTPSEEISSGAAFLVVVLMVVPTLLLCLLLLVVGVLEPAVVALVGLLGPIVAVSWLFRSTLADNPRLLAARHLLWFLILISVGVAGAHAYGVQVREGQTDAFYTTVAQVDAALLLVAAFQSAWARHIQALEGMVLLSVFALALSLTCSLISLARGADSSTLLAFTTAGLAAGFAIVGVGVAQQVAPDLLKSWQRNRLTAGPRTPVENTHTAREAESERPAHGSAAHGPIRLLGSEHTAGGRRADGRSA